MDIVLQSSTGEQATLVSNKHTIITEAVNAFSSQPQQA